MKRLLIANRGEIALRYAVAAAELGLESVGVFAEDDAPTGERIGADSLAALSGRGPKAYLDGAALIRVAETEGCDAVAVGYGFLSENADFAAACEAAGLVFVGPRPETLRRLGDKGQARALALELGVPVAPGTPVDVSIRAIQDFMAEQGGRPIMLKAAGGGGGRGMRVVRDPAELEEAYAAAQREAFAFGASSLYAETLIEQARHVEVQIIGDGEGRITPLWERDCTAQRRHQKLIEIAPAPGLSDGLRAALTDAAIRLGRAARYRNLGTVEFLIDPDGAFAFIEVNPRIQVEHTVTEEIIGVDLVSAQLRLARGESLADLGLAETPPRRGAALQLRINAETIAADGSVKPSGGAIARFAAPIGPGVRVDTVAGDGYGPSPLYDSLLAKLIVAHPSGDYALLLGRAGRALERLRIDGVATNAGFLAAILAHEQFRANAPTTDFVGRETAALTAAAARWAPAASGEGAAADAPGAVLTPPDGAEALTAPLAAVVVEMQAAVGDEIEAGETVALLEALKMEHPVVSPVSGRIAAVLAHPGDVLEEGAPLLFVGDIRARGGAAAATAPVDPDHIRPDLDRVLKRNALVLDENRPAAMEKRRQRGRWSARQNLDALCDPGGFSEFGALGLPVGANKPPIEERIAKGAGDGLVTGFAAVNAEAVGAENAACSVAAVDYTVMAGTQGYMHHRKLDRWLSVAARNAKPVVIFPEGGGGRPNDFGGQDIVAGGLNVDTFHAFCALRGQVPLISVVSGWCFAGNAAFPGASDIVIATQDASIGMGGPAMIEAGGLGAWKPAEVGPARTLYAAGGIDVLVEEEGEAIRLARQAVSYFQGPVTDWSCADQRLLRHAVPENRRRAYEIRPLIETLCDTGSVLELGAGHAPGLITALVRVEGAAFGLIANNPMHLSGALDPEGCDKGARFLRLCEAFRLPLISLCDTPGYMVGPAIEAQGQARRGIGLMVAGARLTTPIFSIVIRKAYGLGAQAMVGGSFTVPRFAIAWPTGELGAMGLEGAVRLAMGKEIDKIEDPAAREAEFQSQVDRLYAMGEALNAAALVELDAVIDPVETRAWIVRGARHAA